MSRSDRASPSRLIDGQKKRITRAAISRSESFSPRRVSQSGELTSATNGFSANEVKRATHPLRELCGSGTKSSTTGTPRESSSSRANDGHAMTSRAMPTITVAAAIISSASGVKSAVTSMRFERGRTPMPVERRFAASSITGIGRM
jgi:hypothetical protein